MSDTHSDSHKGGKARFQVESTQESTTGTAMVIVPLVKGRQPDEDAAARLHKRSPEARLEEAVGLARAIDLDIVHSDTVNVPKLRAGTLFGTGKVAEITGLIAALDVGVVVVDHPAPLGFKMAETELCTDYTFTRGEGGLLRILPQTKFDHIALTSPCNKP